jgi:hypothetical protein
MPGYTVSQGGEPISMSGRIDGEKGDGAGCAWITDSSGKRTQLLWFEERVVLFEPLRFVNSAGSVIARAGDIVTVTGPSGTIGETICAPGEGTFTVEVISGPGGTHNFPTDPPL